MSSDEPQIKFFFTSSSGRANTVANQKKIEQILDAKKIKYEKFDIASSEEAKAEMRKIMGNESGLAPQLCNGDQYCGDFEQMDAANEVDELESFLKLPPKPKAES